MKSYARKAYRDLVVTWTFVIAVGAVMVALLLIGVIR
jgi:hypothetical protein